MRILVVLIIQLLCSLYTFASFPVVNSITTNADPTTDSWLPIIVVFWLLVIIIPIILIRFVKRNLKRKKDN